MYLGEDDLTLSTTGSSSAVPRGLAGQQIAELESRACQLHGHGQIRASGGCAVCAVHDSFAFAGVSILH